MTMPNAHETLAGEIDLEAERVALCERLLDYAADPCCLAVNVRLSNDLKEAEAALTLLADEVAALRATPPRPAILVEDISAAKICGILAKRLEGTMDDYEDTAADILALINPQPGTPIAKAGDRAADDGERAATLDDPSSAPVEPVQKMHELPDQARPEVRAAGGEPCEYWKRLAKEWEEQCGRRKEFSDSLMAEIARLTQANAAAEKRAEEADALLRLSKSAALFCVWYSLASDIDAFLSRSQTQETGR